MIFKQFVRNRAPIIFGFAAGVLLLVGFLWFGRSTTVQANSTDLGNFEGQYPAAVGSAIDTCALCHTSSIPSLNPYGQAYKSNGRSSAALVAIQNADTDGDGFTNIQEINASPATFPGDSTSHPATGITPTATLPAPTATMVPSVTTAPPTATLAPTDTLVPSPTLPGNPPPEETETEEPHVTRTPRPVHTPDPSRTPRPTGQPTVCPTKTNNHDDGGVKSTPGSPEDRDGMNHRPSSSCKPSGGGDDGGGRGGGGDAVTAPAGLIAFFDSLLGIH